jgi:hypothetical protein
VLVLAGAKQPARVPELAGAMNPNVTLREGHD